MCRQKVKVSGPLMGIPFIERQIKNLKVKCSNHTISGPKEVYYHNLHVQDIPLDDQYVSDINDHNKRVRQSMANNHNNPNHKRRKINVQVCDWIGCFSDLEQHESKCPLQLIHCEHCNQCLLRCELSDHYQQCAYYPLQCNKCNQGNILRHEMERHLHHECLESIISCDYCEEDIKRKYLPHHLSKRCPEMQIDCDFKRFGCKERFKRKYLEEHNHQRVHYHLRKVTKSHLKLEQRFNGLMEMMHNNSNNNHNDHDDAVYREMNPNEHPNESTDEESEESDHSDVSCNSSSSASSGSDSNSESSSGESDNENYWSEDQNRHWSEDNEEDSDLN